MKPLQLRIQGLNSFMEEQSIDFSELTEVGLFGIFGPTGSGKSTILDAITLALYGEIPRAGRDLSGVVNAHSDKADIYYEFEIGNKNDKRIYFVQRCYKRDKNGSVSTHRVKLCDITDEINPVVLGEKVNVVNHKVGEILGLSCNDFTRSVVLPQGNFSNFLKLSGREKRDMLERIFALQEYGSQLTKKIRGHKKKIDNQWMVLQGQLNHFDGISQEAYDILTQEIKGLEEKNTYLDEQSKKIEKDYEASSTLWNLQQEYKEYLEKKERLDKERDTIKDYKKQYELAQRAKDIQPYIQSYLETQEKIKKKERDLEIVHNKYQQLIESLEIIKEKWEEQRDKKENFLPLLAHRKVNLENAIDKNNKKDILLKEWHKLNKQEEELSCTLKQSKDKIETIIEDIKQFNTKLMEKQDQREKAHHTAEYKEKLYQAYEIEKDYKKLLLKHREIENYIKEVREKRLYLLMEKKKKIEETLKEIERQIQTYEEEHVRTSQNIEEIKQQNMAALLAKSLEKEQACPVCGSLHHPKRAKFPQDQKISELEELKEMLEEKIKIREEQKEKSLLQQQKITSNITVGEKLIEEKEKEEKATRKDLIRLKEKLQQYQEELKTKNIEAKVQELHKKEQQSEILQKEIKILQDSKEKQENLQRQVQEQLFTHNTEFIKIQQSKIERQNLITELQGDIEKICGKKNPHGEMDLVLKEMDQIKTDFLKIDQEYHNKNNHKTELEKDERGLQDTLSQLHDFAKNIDQNLQQSLRENDFDTIEEATTAFKSQGERQRLKQAIEQHEQKLGVIQDNIERLEKKMQGNSITKEQWEKLLDIRKQINKALEDNKTLLIQKNTQESTMKQQLEKLQILQKEKKDIEHRQGLIDEIDKLFQGNKFVEFIALQQLKYIAREASQELKKITRGRYALELDGEGNFIMRDDFNGGVRRSTKTLSGGETFLTSLSLALALSTHIQLKGRAPLEFFFLDEGFGTLDSSLLEVVMDSLERLHSEKLSVGLISHVDELKQRIPRRLMVSPAVAGMNGTRVKIEIG